MSVVEIVVPIVAGVVTLGIGAYKYRNYTLKKRKKNEEINENESKNHLATRTKPEINSKEQPLNTHQEENIKISDNQQHITKYQPRTMVRRSGKNSTINNFFEFLNTPFLSFVGTTPKIYRTPTRNIRRNKQPQMSHNQLSQAIVPYDPKLTKKNSMSINKTSTRKRKTVDGDYFKENKKNRVTLNSS